MVTKLGNLLELTFTEDKIAGAANFIVGTDEFYVVLAQNIDIEAERERLVKELQYLEGFLKATNAKLQNERFVQNAKPEIIANELKKKADAETKIQIIKDSLE